VLNSLPDWFTNILTALVASLATYFSTRKKENIEIQGGELSNTNEAIKIWRELAQDMTDKVKELSEKIDILTAEVHSLKSENSSLKSKLNLLDENNEVKPKRTRTNKAV
jgi:predicted RNase H-like nuclease (RuvC/YqgF family)